MKTDSQQTELKPTGYSALIKRYNLPVIPNWHVSNTGTGYTHRIETTTEVVEETYPGNYWPGEGLGDHLEFALKYDGTNLAILASLFAVVDPDELTAYIKSKPTGKYARRIWFLYEHLTGNQLQLNDLQRGTYVDLIEPEEQYTATDPSKVRRQRINYNLLGDNRFCPVIRRTEMLAGYEHSDLPSKCRDVVSGYSPELMKRALSYFYTKESKSSFAIESITPSTTRTERFVALLQLAQRDDYCVKSKLIELQNQIVDPRFADLDYRKNQNYVGQSIPGHQEKVHYACPKPADLSVLMAGLLDTHQSMETGMVNPVVHAAVIGYGFVFMHPFEDGNGRIHRFLIHNILSRRGFTPEGVVFPISAAMLNNIGDYDSSLEAFSVPLMPLVEYSLDEDGRMTVLNDTAHWYRYMDMTAQVEALFQFIEYTIEKELVEELEFLKNYDETKNAIQAIVDMPDRLIDLFIRICLQNHGRLSARKRASHFEVLFDDEISRMENVVQSVYGYEVE